MIIPYKLETNFTRIPVTNSILIAITSIFFCFTLFGIIPDDVIQSMVLRDWDLGQMVGSLFLHGGFFHLLGNMLFLWLFGSAVCAAIGNVQYLIVYLFLGIVASSTHLAFSGQPAIGASGAINGIVGMALVLFPLNKLDCIYFFSFPFMGIFWKSGKFSAKAFWMIALWCLYDILGVIIGGGGIAYWAHIGGFAAGMLVGFSFLYFNLIETYDPTLVEVLTGKVKKKEARTLDEIAEELYTKKLSRKAALLEQDLLAGYTTDSLQIHEPVSPVQSPSLTDIQTNVNEPVPVFRVLRIMKKNQDIICYFSNDGDPITNVTIGSARGITAIINPHNLAKRTSGWMQFSNANDSDLQGLSLSFDDGAGGRVTKAIRYNEAERKFLIS
jgi:membrane associated rhomboid family serine protease